MERYWNERRPILDLVEQGAISYFNDLVVWDICRFMPVEGPASCFETTKQFAQRVRDISWMFGSAEFALCHFIRRMDDVSYTKFLAKVATYPESLRRRWLAATKRL